MAIHEPAGILLVKLARPTRDQVVPVSQSPNVHPVQLLVPSLLVLRANASVNLVEQELMAYVIARPCYGLERADVIGGNGRMIFPKTLDRVSQELLKQCAHVIVMHIVEELELLLTQRLGETELGDDILAGRLKMLADEQTATAHLEDASLLKALIEYDPAQCHSSLCSAFTYMKRRGQYVLHPVASRCSLNAFAKLIHSYTCANGIPQGCPV
jgi:hypothetical protein